MALANCFFNGKTVETAILIRRQRINFNIFRIDAEDAPTRRSEDLTLTLDPRRFQNNAAAATRQEAPIIAGAYSGPFVDFLPELRNSFDETELDNDMNLRMTIKNVETTRGQRLKVKLVGPALHDINEHLRSNIMHIRYIKVEVEISSPNLERLHGDPPGERVVAGYCRVKTTAAGMGYCEGLMNFPATWIQPWLAGPDQDPIQDRFTGILNVTIWVKQEERRYSILKEKLFKNRQRDLRILASSGRTFACYEEAFTDITRHNVIEMINIGSVVHYWCATLIEPEVINGRQQITILGISDEGICGLINFYNYAWDTRVPENDPFVALELLCFGMVYRIRRLVNQLEWVLNGLAVQTIFDYVMTLPGDVKRHIVKIFMWLQDNISDEILPKILEVLARFYEENAWQRIVEVEVEALDEVPADERRQREIRRQTQEDFLDMLSLN